MGKLIGRLFLIFVLLAFGWRYFPVLFKGNIAGQFVEVLSQGMEKATDMVKNKLLPKNPQVAREELLRELKKNLEEMKSYAGGTSGFTKRDNPATLSELVAESEGVVAELEATNNNITLKEKIADRILDVFSSEQEICVNK